MDRRFVCQDCGTKWFIHEDRTDDPDLTECGRCGGPLVRFVAASVGGGYGSHPGEPTGELGENG
jgi:predicted nucleic acid-binding Zn ribbon protein